MGDTLKKVYNSHSYEDTIKIGEEIAKNLKGTEVIALFGGLGMGERLNFANAIFYNICDLLTDIAAAVEFRYKGGDLQLFAGFKTFFDSFNYLSIFYFINVKYFVLRW